YGKTVDEWTAVLRDKTNPRRGEAIWALGCFGPEARAAVPLLIDEYRRARSKPGVVDALVRIGGGTEVTVPDLIEQFIKEGCARLTAMGAIGYSPYVRDQLVTIGGPAVPALMDVLKGPNSEMRVCAAELLGDIGPAARAAIPLLIRAIEHPEENWEPV